MYRYIMLGNPLFDCSSDLFTRVHSVDFILRILYINSVHFYIDMRAHIPSLFSLRLIQLFCLHPLTHTQQTPVN